MYGPLLWMIYFVTGVTHSVGEFHQRVLLSHITWGKLDTFVI